ncbi:hypothetical protein KHA80_15000 [Anaerobacillus sp. HL2]|nr:hypothetical protein KHA80_15000 [Anaerobacillus sp. HL2]
MTDTFYATTSQDENGIGNVSRVYIDENRIEPCAIIDGHGWRISSHQDEYFVAGLYTSLYSSHFQQVFQH